MPCYFPLTAWRGRDKSDKSGKYSIVFNVKEAAQPDDPLNLPCGQCIGCRLARSRAWAIRCTHEAQLHVENSFITLTYDDEHLFESDNPWSVRVEDFQNFMKRFRKLIYPKKIRYFHCGEYGGKCGQCGVHVDEHKQSDCIKYTPGRPHFHAIIFGHDWHDQELYAMRNGQRYYTSKTLNKLWGNGMCIIGNVTFESTAYVARYITKKITGDDADDHYTRYDLSTGEIFELNPEYITMSRKPGIGAGWYAEYASDVFPGDKIVIKRGDKYVELPVPKFYDKLLERSEHNGLYDIDDIKAARVQRANMYDDDDYLRREVKHKVQSLKYKKLIRGYEREN